MFKKISIRAKFLLLIAVLAIPVIVLQIVYLVANYHVRINSELNELECFARIISEDFKGYVKDIWKIEETFADYIGTDLNGAGTAIQPALQYAKQQKEGIMSILYLDAKGKVLFSAGEDYFYEPLILNSYIEELNNGKERVIGNLTGNLMPYDKYVIPVLYGIRNQGELSGMVAAFVDAEKLAYNMPNINLYRSFLLLDRDGMIVCSSKFKDHIKNQSSLTDNTGVAKALSGSVEKTVKEKSVFDDSTNISVDYPISEFGWAIKISSPLGRVQSFHTFLAIQSFSLLIATFILAILVHVLWVKKFLKSTFAVKLAATRIMEGDYSARTDIRSEDDIGLIATAFDKMAESVERWTAAKTLLFTNISHELKTPVNVIYASVQLIESYRHSRDLTLETYQNKVSRQMKIIRQNCYRIMRLTSNLIDIGRHDSGFLKPKMENYDIVKLVRDISLSVERYVEAKEIELIFHSELESQIMACDPDMIERILLNLISNAVKFTDRNGMITVSIEDDQDKIILSVQDTGIGIPQDKLQSIFERFKQVDDPYHLNRDGSGIGLSLVNAFVDAHGGTITVVSEESKGTTFQISFPIRVLGNSPANKQEGPISKMPLVSPPNSVNRINIEFSDIYSLYDEEMMQEDAWKGEAS